MSGRNPRGHKSQQAPFSNRYGKQPRTPQSHASQDSLTWKESVLLPDDAKVALSFKDVEGMIYSLSAIYAGHCNENKISLNIAARFHDGLIEMARPMLDDINKGQTIPLEELRETFEYSRIDETAPYGSSPSSVLNSDVLATSLRAGIADYLKALESKFVATAAAR